MQSSAYCIIYFEVFTIIPSLKKKDLMSLFLDTHEKGGLQRFHRVHGGVDEKDLMC